MAPERILNWSAVLAGLAGVALIDYATGVEVHVVSLYFVPLALAATRLGLTPALAAAVGSGVVWTLVQVASGIQHAQRTIWFFNFGTQTLAFAVVAFLMASWAESARRERLREQTDLLTGLRNRQAFVDAAGAALDTCRDAGRPVALACIDVDDLRRLNDCEGHEAGDELLRRCARILGWTLRSVDIVARLGGDEFAVFMPETPSDHAVALLEQLRDTLNTSESFIGAGLTVSVGLTCDRAARQPLGALLKQALAEVEAAKRSRRRRVSVHEWA
ncbi:MAG: GGDEF domain-containing protein [Burkholderiales bacterium]|nr:GGDEF domain-containing protein [Burkholderiales bacterium]